MHKLIHHFSGATATRHRRMSLPMVSGFRRTYMESTSANGNPIVHGLRVFKAGTFKDSLGRENTWTREMLEAMVQNFNYLRVNGLFVDVPIRVDHSMSMENVVGYVASLYMDPEDHDFMSADFEFTEYNAYSRWQSGTYRNRSSEIGEYETNDGETFWPTFLGVAFVDIPAVEGLHSAAKSNSFFSHVITDQEDNLMDITDPRWPQAVAYAAWVQAAEYAQALDDWSRAVTYAAWVRDAEYAQACADWERAVNYAAALQAQGQLPPTPPAPPAPHGGAPTPAFTYRVGNGTTTDPVAVQAELDRLTSEVATLTQFRAEAIEASRKNFVDGLAKDNKIMATQVDSLKGVVASMTPEQFNEFKAAYDAAPALGLFQRFDSAANHGGGQGGEPGNGAPSDIETAKSIVANHRVIGMPEEDLKATDSYKKLVAAGIEQA